MMLPPPDHCSYRISSDSGTDALVWAIRLGPGYETYACEKCGRYHFRYSGPPVGTRNEGAEK